MIIVLKAKTKKGEIESLIEKIKEKGLKPVAFEGEERTVIHVLGDTKEEAVNGWSSIRCVEKVMRI